MPSHAAVRRLTLAATVSLLLAAPAAAQAPTVGQPGVRSPLQFDYIDRNMDKLIDREEARAYRERLLHTVDVDGNGRVILEEWLTASRSAPGTPGGRGIEAEFAAADTNGDGAVTLEEMAAEGDRRFARLDQNGDGNLTAEEYRMGGL